MHRRLRSAIVALFVCLTAGSAAAAGVRPCCVSGDIVRPESYSVSRKAAPVVGVAMQMMCSDMEAVTGRAPLPAAAGEAVIRIVQSDVDGVSLKGLGVPAAYVDSLKAFKEAFYIGVHGGRIVVVGSDARGTAYGVLEISRLAGVSPWVWWGDVTPASDPDFALEEGWCDFQHPSVEYRGIFLNDEDWSYRVWSAETFDPQQDRLTISARSYREIFKLLLRLRANAIWPGMHPGTTAFFTVPGAREAADSCGIVVGTTHCEPLLRNNVGEWDVSVRGRYDFINNRQSVLDYWTERLKEIKGGEYMYTLGMRGIHDGNMEGVHTLQEKTEGLQAAIDAQRDLLSKYASLKVPQIFVPYKEVLGIMENGLVVPEDVTLIWCDDNYGYMTRLGDEERQRRSGGAGVYYHLSYCGRPHDFLWLTTLQPGLIYSEMRHAYDFNARKFWVVNVHDVKVASYDLELFLDMAWDIDCIGPRTVNGHIRGCLERDFGADAGRALAPVMSEFYRLCAIRKPEFMGWSQTELGDRTLYPRGLSKAGRTEFSFKEFGSEAVRFMAGFGLLSSAIDSIREAYVPDGLADAYFAAIEYPVKAASAMARKCLYGQLARELAVTTYSPGPVEVTSPVMEACALSTAAYREIESLTYRYNALGGGRWKGIMNSHPRDLPVFWPAQLPFLPAEGGSAASGGAAEDGGGPAAAEQPDGAVVSSDGAAADSGGLSAVSASGSLPAGGGAAVSEADISGCRIGARLPVYSLPDGVLARNASTYDGSSAEVVPVQNLGHSASAVPVPEGESIRFSFIAPRMPQKRGASKEVGEVSAVGQPASGQSASGQPAAGEPAFRGVLRVALIPTQPSDTGDLRFSVRIDGGEPLTFSLKEPFRSEQWKLNVLRGQAVRVVPVELGPGTHTLELTALDDNIIFDQWMLDCESGRKFYVFPCNPNN